MKEILGEKLLSPTWLTASWRQDIALPAQLFFNTGIPACLWFVRRGKEVRIGEVLFIDARNLGEMITRRNKDLSQADIIKITDTYQAWRGQKLEDGSEGHYEDILGYCKSAELKDIEKHNFILTPGRYVGIPEEEDDGVEFEEKMKELAQQLKEQMEEGKRLDEEIKKNLESIGFEI